MNIFLDLSLVVSYASWKEPEKEELSVFSQKECQTKLRRTIIEKTVLFVPKKLHPLNSAMFNVVPTKQTYSTKYNRADIVFDIYHQSRLKAEKI